MRRAVGAVAVGVVVAGSLVGWHVLSRPSHAASFASTARVTDVQKAAIASYFVHHDLTGTSFARVGCPVDVLGARRSGAEVTVYTVVHCWTGAQNCSGSYDGADGVVADLSGDRVESARFDDADDRRGINGEAVIYPPALRSLVEELMNDGGPDGYDAKAVAIAGCTGAAT